MSPSIICPHCSGTGLCFKCNGRGSIPARPQAQTALSAEELLGLTPPAPVLPAPAPEPSASAYDRLAYLKTALHYAVKASERRDQALGQRIDSETRAHAKAISALEELLSELESKVNSVRRTEITLRDSTGSILNVVSGPRHPQFETLLRAASARDAAGLHPNVWIAGPAGSGKTTGGRQLAQALGLPFYFNGAVSMEHKLLGFRDATGHYHETPFRRGFEQPAVYQFDDVDSSDNSALLALNAALANGECDFADKLVPRHRDSIILATANTWGLGATSDYVGRVKLDAAFLSRFPVKIFWDYNEPFEAQISGNPAWAKRVQQARARARAAGLKVVIDPRQTIAGAALLASGFSEAQAAELTYLANLNPEQRKLVQ